MCIHSCPYQYVTVLTSVIYRNLCINMCSEMFRNTHLCIKMCSEMKHDGLQKYIMFDQMLSDRHTLVLTSVMHLNI